MGSVPHRTIWRCRPSATAAAARTMSWSGSQCRTAPWHARVNTGSGRQEIERNRKRNAKESDRCARTQQHAQGSARTSFDPSGSGIDSVGFFPSIFSICPICPSPVNLRKVTGAHNTRKRDKQPEHSRQNEQVSRGLRGRGVRESEANTQISYKPCGSSAKCQCWMCTWQGQQRCCPVRLCGGWQCRRRMTRG